MYSHCLYKFLLLAKIKTANWTLDAKMQIIKTENLASIHHGILSLKVIYDENQHFIAI